MLGECVEELVAHLLEFEVVAALVLVQDLDDDLAVDVKDRGSHKVGLVVEEVLDKADVGKQVDG